MSTVFDDSKIINGLYGFLYDGDGKQLQTAQEFEAAIEFDKEEIKVPGVFLKKHRVLGGSGSGKMTLLKVDSRLVKAIADDPTAKYNFQGQLKDPNNGGEEAIMFKGVSFDAAPLMNYKLGEMVETELDFTFDDYEYKKSIG